MFYKSSRRFKVAFVIVSLAILLAGMLALLAINQNKALATSGTVSVAISVSGNEEGGSATLSKTSYTSGDEVIVNWTGAVVDNDFVIPTSIILSESDKTYSISDWIDVSAMQENNTAYFKQMGESYTMTSFIKAGEYVTKTHSFSLGTISNDCTVIVNFERVTPVYRLYNKITSEHLFTTNKAEYDSFGTLLEQGSDYWIGEGIDWLAPKSGNYVKRLYNAGLGAQLRSSHYYTSDVAEIQDLVANQGWVEDSQENWFMSGGTTPIYTAYSEALGSSHHYTSSWDEWRGLDGGWDKEETKNGIASNSASATGVANCIIGTNWSGTLPEEGQDVYTRGEWIQTIVDAYGLTLDLENASETKFTDIESCQYKDAIRIAEIHGALDDGETFSPDSVATREFAADSAVRLIGYTEDGEPDCSDVSSIAKKNSVYLALKTGMFELSNDHFDPSADMLKTDGKLVTDHFAYILSLRVVDESKNKGAEYNDNAVLVDENVSYEDNNGQLTIDKTEALNSLQVGNVIVIGEKIAYKVDSFTEQDGKLVVNYSAPQLDDFITSLQVSASSAEVDWSEAVLAEGVQEVETSGDIASLADANSIIDKTYTVKILDGVDLNVSLGNFNVDANFDYELPSNVKNAFFQCSYDTSVSLTISKSKTITVEQFANLLATKNLESLSVNYEKPIIEVPIVFPSAPSLNPKLKITLELNCEGRIELKVTTTTVKGFHVINNLPADISDDKTSFSVMGEIEGDFGWKAGIGVACFGFVDLVDFNAGPSIVLSASATPHANQPFLCINASVYSKIKFTVSLLEGFLKISASPFEKKLLEGHLEYGTGGFSKLEECSRTAEKPSVITKSTLVSVPNPTKAGGREIATWTYQVLSNPKGTTEIDEINEDIESSIEKSARKVESTLSFSGVQNVVTRRDIQVSYLENGIVCFVDTSWLTNFGEKSWVERGGVAYRYIAGQTIDIAGYYYDDATKALNATKEAVRTYLNKYGSDLYSIDEIVRNVSLSISDPKGIALSNRGRLAIFKEGLVYLTQAEEVGSSSMGYRGIIVKPSSDEYQVGEIVNGIS